MGTTCLDHLMCFYDKSATQIYTLEFGKTQETLEIKTRGFWQDSTPAIFCI